MFEECGFYYAKPLATGPLEELLKMDPAFQTSIPSIFNLPPLEKNTSEGLVLKPVKTLYFTSVRTTVIYFLLLLLKTNFTPYVSRVAG